MSELRSKKLFNFAPKGEYDQDVQAFLVKEQQNMKKDYGIEALIFKDDDNAVDENTKLLRDYMEKSFTKLGELPHYVNIMKKCSTKEFTIPENNIKVYVHIPHSLENVSDRTAIVYAHGGGVVSGTARAYQPATACLAVETGCVVFSVEYRLAPETKCPDNIMDFYNCLKYVRDNSKQWNLDTEKIIISGESGGGYIVFGTMVVLATRDESHLVKAAIPIIPMISDYGFSDTEAMTLEERMTVKQGMHLMWKYIAKDLDADWKDPLLFPSKASDELIKKMPPTIIFSAEFDIFITETERMARRMRQNGKLLEFCCIPGISHGHYMYPQLKCYRVHYDAYKLAVDEYVKN